MTTLQMIRTHALAAILTALALATVSTASAAPAKTGYARSGDLDLYYEVHGSGGTPLVVLQGSFCTVEICFGQMLPDPGCQAPGDPDRSAGPRPHAARRRTTRSRSRR